MKREAADKVGDLLASLMENSRNGSGDREDKAFPVFL